MEVDQMSRMYSNHGKNDELILKMLSKTLKERCNLRLLVAVGWLMLRFILRTIKLNN